jgi:hypothetical protein
VDPDRSTRWLRSLYEPSGPRARSCGFSQRALESTRLGQSTSVLRIHWKSQHGFAICGVALQTLPRARVLWTEPDPRDVSGELSLVEQADN